MGDRFYCPGFASQGRVSLQGEEAKHLARVRRVAVGKSVELFDGDGRQGQAEVVAIGRDTVELQVSSSAPGPRDIRGTLTLATAVPKGERFDWLVEKATELGVTRLVPIVTSRSVVDPRTGKLERLRRLVIEACKQSGRSRLMEVGPVISWDAWLRSGSGGAAALLMACPGGPSMAEVGPIWLADGVAVAIGPEGGFTDAEIEEARRAGYRMIGLGPTILRVETAAVSACAGVVGWAGG